MNKKLNVFLFCICCVLALYGLSILIRKVLLSPNVPRKTRKELGMKFFIEPYKWYEIGEIQEDIVEKNQKCRNDCNKKCSEQFPNDSRMKNFCTANCVTDMNC